jgi:hypothetical protein
MALFDVPLFEGREKRTFRVEAESKEEAFAKAKAFREQRFQEQTSREALESERQEIEAERANAPSTPAAAFKGAQQGAVNIFTGAADAALDVAGAIVDFRAGGMGGGGMAQVSEAIEERRANLDQFAADFNVDIRERVAGRQLTAAEREKTIESAERDVELANMATDIAVAAPVGALTLKASTMPRMIAGGSAEGFLSGYLLTDTKGETSAKRNEERLGTAKIGAALGGGMSIIPGLFAGVKNMMVRAVKKLSPDIAEQRRLMQAEGINAASLGQLTGDPRMLRIEADAAGPIADRMFRQQQVQARETLSRKLGVTLPDMAEMTTGNRAVVDEGLALVKNGVRTIRGRRNKAFEQGLNAIEEATGGRPIIGTGKFADQANELIATIQQNFDNVPMGSQIKSIFRTVNNANDVGGLTPKQANAILLKLGQMKRSGAGMFDSGDDVVKGSIDTYRGFTQKYANVLKNTLEQAFDESADRLGGTAGAQLKQLRTEYAAASREASAIESDMLASLGLRNTDTGTILRKLGDADVAVVRKVMETLEDIPGGQAFKGRLRDALYKQAVQDGSAAARTTAAKAGDFNLKAFADSLMRNTDASRLKGIITPQQERYAVASAKQLKKLFNDPVVGSPSGVLKTHLGIDLQGIAINVMSRDPGFMARLVASAVQKGKGAEALFFTKEGQDLLTGAVKSVVAGRKTGATINGITAVLASMTGAGAADDRIRDETGQDPE